MHYRTFWYQIMYLFPKIFQVFLGTLIISSNPYLSLFPLYSPPSKHEKTDAFWWFQGDKSATLEKIGYIYKTSLTAKLIEIFIKPLLFCSLSITKWILTRFSSFTLAELATRNLFNTTLTYVWSSHFKQLHGSGKLSGMLFLLIIRRIKCSLSSST